MFSNRFNTKNDPLVEAVQNAMQDGEIRRQAEALVNEEFGVYNRNAVVREDLAAYDAAIEEAYKCMKEGNPNDGNLANNYPPYDKVTRGDVIAGATGKDQMGGKKKKMEEEEQIDERNLLKRMKDTMRLGSSGKERVDRISGALSDRGGNWDYKKGDFTEKGKSQVKSRLKNVKGASDYALNKEETQIDEISHKLALKAMKKSDERGEEEYDRDMTDDRLSDPKTHWDRAKRLRGHMKRKFGNKTIKTGGSDNLSPKSYEQGGGERRRADKLKKGPRAGMISARHRDKLKDNIKYSLGKHKKPNLPEEVDYSAPDRAAVTRDNKPSTPAQTNAATSGPSAADKAALTSKIKTMQEAAYSAKAARAGKDIGKPGKEFKRIAKSASERYGSEERGKKVAGAILKKIRAKHMREDAMTTGMASSSVKRSMASNLFNRGATQAAQAATSSPATSAATGAARSGVLGPIAAGASLGAGASQLAKGLATGTETGRSIGKAIGSTSIGQSIASGMKKAGEALGVREPDRFANVPRTITRTPGSPEAKAAATQLKADKKAPSVGDDRYTIKKGDTLSSIAKRSGTTVDALAKANKITNVNKIGAGQKISTLAAKSPMGGDTSTPKPTTPGSMKVSAQPAPTAGPSGQEKMDIMSKLPPKPAPTTTPGSTKISAQPAPSAGPSGAEKMDTMSKLASAPKPAATPAPPPSMSMSDPKAQKLRESVQVGANKYRIV